MVVNLHFAIPHKNNGGRDDVQVLWDSESLHNTFYSTTNDITSTDGCGGTTTGAQCANNIGLGVPVYIDSSDVDVPIERRRRLQPASGLNSLSHCVTRYYFPSTTNRTAPFRADSRAETRLGTTRKS